MLITIIDNDNRRQAWNSDKSKSQESVESTKQLENGAHLACACVEGHCKVQGSSGGEDGDNFYRIFCKKIRKRDIFARCRVPLGVRVGLRWGPQLFLHETTRREAGFYIHLSWSGPPIDGIPNLPPNWGSGSALASEGRNAKRARLKSDIRLSIMQVIYMFVDQPAGKRESQAPGLHPSRGDSQV